MQQVLHDLSLRYVGNISEDVRYINRSDDSELTTQLVFTSYAVFEETEDIENIKNQVINKVIELLSKHNDIPFNGMVQILNKIDDTGPEEKLDPKIIKILNSLGSKNIYVTAADFGKGGEEFVGYIDPKDTPIYKYTNYLVNFDVEHLKDDQELQRKCSEFIRDLGIYEKHIDELLKKSIITLDKRDKVQEAKQEFIEKIKLAFKLLPKRWYNYLFGSNDENIKCYTTNLSEQEIDKPNIQLILELDLGSINEKRGLIYAFYKASYMAFHKQLAEIKYLKDDGRIKYIHFNSDKLRYITSFVSGLVQVIENLNSEINMLRNREQDDIQNIADRFSMIFASAVERSGHSL